MTSELLEKRLLMFQANASGYETLNHSFQLNVSPSEEEGIKTISGKLLLNKNSFFPHDIGASYNVAKYIASTGGCTYTASKKFLYRVKLP